MSLNPRISLYLDGVRAACALMVVASHWAYARFTAGEHGWIRDHDLGGEAVTVFFVMSGFVIAATAERRSHEGITLFAADRLSRLWSVAIPAILLTFALDPIGALLRPDVYAGGFYQGDTPLLRIFAALTFTNEALGLTIRPGSNGPWWSLSYEALYYAIFAAAFFLRGMRRIIWVGALAFLAGWKVLLLMPSWLIGVALWRVVRGDALAALSKPTGWVLTLAPVAIYLFAHIAGTPGVLKEATWRVLGPELWRGLGFSDTFVWANLLALLVFTHLAGVFILMGQSRSAPRETHMAQAVRWLAGGSFALYLFHYPILQFFGAILPGDLTDAWRQAALLACGVAFPYALAALTEHRRDGLRRLLRRLATPVDKLRPSPS